MNKTLTALVLTSGALMLGACSDKPVSKVEVPVSSYQAKPVFRVNSFEPTTALVVGYDTDKNPRTIEEAVVVRNRSYGVYTPGPIDLESLPRSDWDYLVAPGATPKRYVTDHTSTMTPEQQAVFNRIAQLTGYK